MSEHVATLTTRKHSRLGTYVSGYLLSIYLTMTAYLLVVNHAFDNALMVSLLVILAVLQFFVQMVYFLHLSFERHDRWRLFVFGLMVLVVGILLSGSIWIMNNLSYRMSPQQVNSYMNSQDSL